MKLRAIEWRQFRRDFLYSQEQLAQALDISRRTIQSIESAATVYPHCDIQRKFVTLKQEHMRDVVERRKRERETEIALRRQGIASGKTSAISDLFRRERVALRG